MELNHQYLFENHVLVPWIIPLAGQGGMLSEPLEGVLGCMPSDDMEKVFGPIWRSFKEYYPDDDADRDLEFVEFLTSEVPDPGYLVYVGICKRESIEGGGHRYYPGIHSIHYLRLQTLADLQKEIEKVVTEVLAKEQCPSTPAK